MGHLVFLKVFVCSVFLISANQAEAKATSKVVSKSVTQAPRRPADFKCERKEKNFASNLTIPEYKRMFDQIPRRELTRIGWSELLEDKADSVFLPIFHYLAHTENNEKLRNYYKAMLLASTEETDTLPLIRKWPERPYRHNVMFNINQLCEIYEKSLK